MLSLRDVTPLAACVAAVVTGCLIGGAAGFAPEIAARWLVLACAVLVVAARLAWAGHARIARPFVVTAALGLGVAMGALAEARAWDPPGVGPADVEAATAAGEAVEIAGVLRRDASRAPGGGASLDLEVRRLRWRGVWHEARVGVRATVAGESGESSRASWTRGRHIRAPVSSLRRPLPYRNFGVTDTERALARRGMRLFATIKSASLVETTPGPWWEEWAAAVRARVRLVVLRHVREPVAAATVAAILIGDRSSLEAELVRDLQHAGVYHVVAISGGNVGIWLALLVWLPRAAGAGAKLGVVWLGAALLGFAVVVDGGASVSRAVTVAGVVVAARWWDLRTPALQALCVAAGLQWLGDPLAWHDAGCVLSFGAAGTLVLVAAAWSSSGGPAHAGVAHWARRGATLGAALVGATIAVEAVLLPISARWFHVATVAGVLANLLAVPAMGVVQVAGLALVPAAALWPPVGDGIGVVAAHAVRVLLRSADIVSVAPWLVHEVPPPSTPVLATYYLALVVCARCCVALVSSSCGRCGRASWSRRGLRARAGLGALTGLTVMGCLVWMLTGGVEHSAPAPWTWRAATRWQRASWPAEPWLLVTFLDVGQGDATVIRFPSGRTWLVDAGGSISETFDTGERVTSPALWALGHRAIDRVVVTHAHPDHAAGMPTVIKRLRPRESLAGIDVVGEPRQGAIVTAAAQVGARQRWLAAGERLGDASTRLSVLHPERPDWERRRVRNDDSVVLWLQLGDFGLLLPGDVSQGIEDRLIPRLSTMPLAVVRLPHHGSASSSGARLLDALSPVLAVGSMGRGNRFGHPASAVLRRLAERRVPLLRTDRDGAIQLATNGRVLLVRTANGLEGSLTGGPPRRAWWLATPLPSRPATPHPRAGPPARAAPRPGRTAG